MNGESRRMAGLWLAVVFLLGAGIGAVFSYTFLRRNVVAAPSAPAALSEPERRAKRVAEISKEVGLTPEQSAKVDAIIQSAHAEMKAIRDKADADVEIARQKARDQMRSFLTPEQKPKFEAMVRRMDAERKNHQPPPAK